jgi:hypothetical protein
MWQYGFTATHMKTTIDIPDALMIRAKKRAAELRCPVRELVIEGLQARLDEKPDQQTAKKRVKIRWVVSQGGVSPGLNLANREELADWMQRPL